MNNVPDNELLSAYLDGELTAAEQVEVEQLLSGSPEARQLLEEFRALSSTLQGLPQHKLGEDLSGPVLRIAERRMLTQPAPEGELPKPAPAPRAMLRRILNSRALVWSSLAVAVAVMLTVLGREPQQRLADQRIASRPATRERGRDDLEIRAAQKAGEVSESAPIEEAETLPKAIPAEGSPRGDAMKGGPTLAAGSRESIEALDAPGRRTQQVAKSLAPEGPAAPGEGVAQPPAAPGFETPQAPAPSLTVNGASSGNAPMVAKGGPAMAAKGGPELPTGYAVVLCDVSPRAFKTQALDRVLAANGIALVGPMSEEDLSAAAQAYTATVRNGREEFDEAVKLRQATGADQEALPVDGKLDLVCVEADPAQIEATLAALSAEPAEFLAVSVTPAPGVLSQQKWDSQYSRRLDQPVLEGAMADSGRTHDAAAEVDGRNATATQTPEQQRDAEGYARRSVGQAWRLQVPEPMLRERDRVDATWLAKDETQNTEGDVPPAGEFAAELQQLERAPSGEALPVPAAARAGAAGGMAGGSSRGGTGLGGRGAAPRQSVGRGGGMGGFGGGMAAPTGGMGGGGFARGGPAQQPAPSALGASFGGQPPDAAGQTVEAQRAIEDRQSDQSGVAEGKNGYQQLAVPAQQQPGPQQQQLAEPAYRVLFVLRMLGPDVSGPPTSAASAGFGGRAGRQAAPPRAGAAPAASQ
jgi:anti-sigma factor RsiW